MTGIEEVRFLFQRIHILIGRLLCGERNRCAGAMLLCLFMVSGCQLWSEPEEPLAHSLLQAARPSAGSVAVEIIWARVPKTNDLQAFDEAVWHRVDESQLSVEVRRELQRNGFRAGVISGSPPDAIVEAFHFTAKQTRNSEASELNNLPGNNSATTVGMNSTKITGEDLTHESKVKRRLLQLKPGRRAEIQASDVYASIPIFQMRDGNLAGQTFRDAQGIYALGVELNQDRTVDIDLTPELHHGQPHLRFEGTEQGVFRQTPSREREIYSAMRMELKLAPGEMIILMSTEETDTSLGHYFHSASGEKGEQKKIVLIRLAQVPESNFFAKSPNNWWPW